MDGEVDFLLLLFSASSCLRPRCAPVVPTFAPKHVFTQPCTVGGTVDMKNAMQGPCCCHVKTSFYRNVPVLGKRVVSIGAHTSVGLLTLLLLRHLRLE